MSEKPILFSGPMVRAILDGSKTQTRRIVKSAVPEGFYIDRCHWSKTGFALWYDDGGCSCKPVPAPFFPGDLLWVRETCTWPSVDPNKEAVLYRADPVYDGMGKGDFAWDWKPSIFMPRWASRITLEVLDVRVERLNSMTEKDAFAEGAEPRLIGGWPGPRQPSPMEWYRTLWDSINGKKHPWSSNPWVWVIEFKKVENA